MQETLNGILTLLDSAEKLLLNGGNEAISAGLYTYAFEEYGKLFLLKTCVPSNGNVEINEEWFGKRTKSSRGPKSHSPKFKAAINNLPDECKILGAPIFEKGCVGPGVQIEETVIADFEARKSIFYCDLNDANDDIKPVVLIDSGLLKNAIKTLETITYGTSIP